VINRSQLFATLLATEQADVMVQLASIMPYAYHPLAISHHLSSGSTSDTLAAANLILGLGES
jgi:hypothetical protein